jgi:hypothetical protein
MKKSKLVFFMMAMLAAGLSSCGLFHKGCGCPKVFYKSSPKKL